MVEKGVDVKLAVDMLNFSSIYDTAILVSGDGDFEYAIYGAKNMGKHVENAYFSSGHSDQLKQSCDKFILLDELVKIGRSPFRDQFLQHTYANGFKGDHPHCRSIWIYNNDQPRQSSPNG